MPQRQILIATFLAVFAALLPTSARADQRSVQCAIQWSGLQGSKDRAALSNFAAKCAGTDAGRAATARIAKLWPRVVVKPDKPDRPKPDKPVQPDRPPPPRQLSYAELHERGLRDRYSVTTYQSARRDFGAACFGGAIGQACHDLGLSYAVPPTGSFDYPNALRAYREGCRLDNRAACAGLVSYSAPKSQGGYVADDYRNGLDRLCRGFGSGEHCNLLGVSYSTAAEGANYPLALDALKRGCNATLASACESLRVFYSYTAFTNPINLPLAKEAFDRAFGVVVGSPTCSGVYAQSCLDLGNYYNANARAGSEAKRLALHKGACDGGKPLACGYAAGTIWLSGGRVGNMADVRTLYIKACNAPGDALSCHNLAATLRDAAFGRVDMDAAQTAQTRACQGGYKPSCPPANPYLAPKK